ncbi:MAG: nucleotidyl transferase AbiEii/AbiGii toxin family protein [Candidatus Aminicenantes bacterium]|nr:nucleotidyl transferase AbiEii/AbiGii toxin family protein [Candidatus Aminicenantes bacterium]
MIPRAYIQEWRNRGFSWKTDAMVEQDLIISRVLIELFDELSIASHLVFRGGTALHKLFFDEPFRYSEDVDLVQSKPGPIGPLFNAIRTKLIDWLGEPKRKTGPDTSTLSYRIDSEDQPPLPLRVKIEINTREHSSFLPVEFKKVEVRSRWFDGAAMVSVNRLEELLATKLRALYQRRKGRDLFDLAMAIRTLNVDTDEVVRVFKQYCDAEGIRIGVEELRKNVQAKLDHSGFLHDCDPIIRPGVSFDLRGDFELIEREILSVL